MPQALDLWMPSDQAAGLAPMVVGALDHRGYRLIEVQTLHTIEHVGDEVGRILQRPNDT